MKKEVLGLLVLCLGLSMEVNAQNRLYPTQKEVIPQIAKRHLLRDSLFLNGGDFDYFAFMILPPYYFGDQVCYYDAKDSVLVLKVAKDGDPYYKDFILEYYCPASSKVVKSLYRLMFSAIFSSSYLARRSGLDGTGYQVYVRCGSWRKWNFVAECWSPLKDSNCGQLADILKRLVAAIKEKDSNAIESLIPLVDELTAKFEVLYPDDVKESSGWLQLLER